MEFENTIRIERPVGEVFDFLANFENVPRWNYAIDETRKTSPGPVGVGTTFGQVRSVPSRSEEHFEVTEFEPDTSLAIRGTFGSFAGTLVYELSEAEGGTVLVNRANLSGLGVARLVAPITARRLRDAVATNLSKLKEILEAR